MDGDLFFDGYFIGALLYFLRRVFIEIPVKFESDRKIKSLFSALVTILISSFTCLFWVFLVSWNFIVPDDDIKEIFGGEKRIFNRIMVFLLVLSALNSCTYGEVDQDKERNLLKDAKAKFELIPEENIVDRNIAAFKLNEMINQAGVYGWIHKWLAGGILGLTKYSEIYENTAQFWRENQNNKDFYSPYEITIFEEVKKISGSQFDENIQGYKKLSELNPSKALYNEKIQHYKNRVAERSKVKRQESYARCKEKQERNAKNSCMLDPGFTYCGIVYKDRPVTGSGCSSVGRATCESGVARVLIAEGC